MAAKPIPVINVAAICGSLRSGSFNRLLLQATMKMCPELIQGMKIVYIDISALPMMNPDLVVDGTFPPAVEAFRQKIKEVDAFLFGCPEYNCSVSPPLKNALDWASLQQNIWAGKSAAILSAGGFLGGGRSQYHLRQIGVFLDLHFINKPEFFLKAFQPPIKFDGEGNLIDEAARENIKEVILALHTFTLGRKNQC